MKNSGEKGTQAALYQQDEAFDMPDSKEGLFTINSPEQRPNHLQKKNNIIGFSEDLRIKLLTSENERLKSLVESLVLDKQSQAQRIMELNEEKSRLKKALADVMLNRQ